MHSSAADPIDTHQIDFLSYGPPIGGRRPGMEELRVAVEPESGDSVAGENAQLTFPLRKGKVQRPLLPDDTLRRDRLLDWMAAKIRRRVIYIVAEAGFGKTTLVADFARRSRIRTFWYRLDEDDTDGLVFLRYLVASCRMVEPGLLAQTAALLTETSINPITLESVLATFLTEFEHLGDMPSMIVLDDYYLAEHVPSIRSTLEKLIVRAPGNLTFVFATRRTPNLSVAVLRARNALAELGRDELCFEPAETGQLFAQSYHHPLEADVLEDVQARTDGWAASLQLVKTAVEGRTPAQIRAFVRSLSGAEGHLYDYLAQEVVGELDSDLRNFLMRAALLDKTETEASAEIAGVSEPVARRLIDDAQKRGLLSRVDAAVGCWRLHPLVREFLMARLEAEIGEDGVVELHRQAAKLFEPISWRLAARHWAAAGQAAEVRRVLCASVPTVIATGDLGAAEDFMRAFPDASPNPCYSILKARVLISEGNYLEALRLVQEPAPGDGVEEFGDLAIARGQCLVTLGMLLDDLALYDRGSRLLTASGDPELAAVVRAAQSRQASLENGSLDVLCLALEEAAFLSSRSAHVRYEGISRLNLAEAEMVRDRHAAGLDAALTALELLHAKGDHGDVQSSKMTLARALAHLGQRQKATQLIDQVLSATSSPVDSEWICDAVEIETLYGMPSDQLSGILRSRFRHPETRTARLHLAMARLEYRVGHHTEAWAHLEGIERPGVQPGFTSQLLALRLQILACTDGGSSEFVHLRQTVLAFTANQQAWFWWKTASLTGELVVGEDPAAYIRSMLEADRVYLSVAAEIAVSRLGSLDNESLEIVFDEALRRPDRWRDSLRRILTQHGAPLASAARAAELLDKIGTREDILLLRRIAKRKSLGVPAAGRNLIRKLAPVVYVEDLGRISIRLGDRVLVGAEVRKKVLSLLGFLLTRPQFSATREQILDALWPDLDPDAAANSLNQTSYFLRRILEPGYTEDRSAGYLNGKADLIWLDRELVGSRSADCLKLLAEIRRTPQPDLVSQLAESYRGRFGTDFLYDDWAGAFRDNLHAAFLDRIERSISEDIRIGAFDRGIVTAQRALIADPDAEQVELQLLRLYRLTGAHGAAAEQYAHYASVLREQLGIEPPPLESI